jgi:anti-sigma regulatory factor (Ser/Thr protein kinase)
LYALLDLRSGKLRYANAGHTLPYRLRYDFSRPPATATPAPARVDALRATGMPLGLIPGLDYAERETMLIPGETVLFYSDGIVEARNSRQELYGFPRLKAALASAPDLEGAALIAFLERELAAFIGPDTEPEDDTSLVYLERSPFQTDPAPPTGAQDVWRALAEFSLPSERGNERLALARVTQVVQELDLPPAHVERLETAVAEATMNAIQHGNQDQPELPVRIQVWVSQDKEYLVLRVTDQARAPLPEFEAPDLAAKLAGKQAPRGWGRFLMQAMVDEVRDIEEDAQHTVELIMFLPRKGATS